MSGKAARCLTASVVWPVPATTSGAMNSVVPTTDIAGPEGYCEGSGTAEMNALQVHGTGGAPSSKKAIRPKSVRTGQPLELSSTFSGL